MVDQTTCRLIFTKSLPCIDQIRLKVLDVTLAVNFIQGMFLPIPKICTYFELRVKNGAEKGTDTLGRALAFSASNYPLLLHLVVSVVQQAPGHLGGGSELGRAPANKLRKEIHILSPRHPG